MKTKKLIMQIILFLAIMALLTGSGFAQKPNSGSSLPQGKVTMKGQIGFMQSLGGYYVKGDAPPTTLFIENQNPKILDELSKSGKKISIEGHFTAGADYLFIEKIDGRPYQGEPAGK